MRNKATIDFPNAIYVTVGSYGDGGKPDLFARDELCNPDFADENQPFVAVYKLEKVQRFEKIERLVDL